MIRAAFVICDSGFLHGETVFGGWVIEEWHKKLKNVEVKLVIIFSKILLTFGSKSDKI